MAKGILIFAEDTSGRTGWGSYSSAIVDNLSSRGRNVRIVSSSSDKAEDPSRLAILPRPLQLRRNYPFALWYATRIFFTFSGPRKPDLIHCTVETYAFIAFIAARLMGVPYILTVHGTYSIRIFSTRYAKLQRIAYRNADRIIAVSSYTKRVLEGAYDGKNVIVIRNGVRSGAGSTKRSGDGRTILSVGAFKPRKGYHLLIPALSRVVARFPDVRHCIAGTVADEEYLASLQELVRRHGLEKNVTLLPNVSNDTLQELYERSDIFVLTPIREGDSFEGFGLVYLEAGSHGIPAIGSRESGAEDAIDHGITGLLADPYNEQDVADAIIKMLSDHAERSKMSSASLKRARASSWERVMDEYEAVYENVAKV